MARGGGVQSWQQQPSISSPKANLCGAAFAYGTGFAMLGFPTYLLRRKDSSNAGDVLIAVVMAAACLLMLAVGRAWVKFGRRAIAPLGGAGGARAGSEYVPVVQLAAFLWTFLTASFVGWTCGLVVFCSANCADDPKTHEDAMMPRVAAGCFLNGNLFFFTDAKRLDTLELAITLSVCSAAVAVLAWILAKCNGGSAAQTREVEALMPQLQVEPALTNADFERERHRLHMHRFLAGGSITLALVAVSAWELVKPPDSRDSRPGDFVALGIFLGVSGFTSLLSASRVFEYLNQGWSHPLFEWGDCVACEPDCVNAFCCPCVVFGANQHKQGEASAFATLAWMLSLGGCCGIWPASARARMRNQFEIPGSGVRDFFAHCLCFPFALLQETRQLNSRSGRRSSARQPSGSKSKGTLAAAKMSSGDCESEYGIAGMCGLSILVGCIAGVGAWGFRMLIGLVHNLLFLGEWNFFYDANKHTPKGPFGAWIILAPAVPSILVTWLIVTFAPEAKGHGVPEVMDAIHHKKGLIKPVVAAVKSFASGISIGSGGSVGREGPIIQIGSAFGSSLGQLVRCTAAQRITLIACGAGGGIAATFNAPIGGVVFAVELLLLSVNHKNLFPLGLATVTSSYIGNILLGLKPAFPLPALAVPLTTGYELYTLLLFIPFGVIVGLFSVAFVKGIYWAEDTFDAMPGPSGKNSHYYTAHLIGMTMMGALMYFMMQITGHYYVQGVGYATIEDTLNANTVKLSPPFSNPLSLFLLCGLKFAATLITIGGGASGGIFSPSLFMGATLGGACGHLTWVLGMSRLHTHAQLQVIFSVAGMAGTVGGTTGAVLTAITMVFEMTRDYAAILPIIITVVTAHATRKHLCNDSIYTLKLLRRGHVVPEGLQAAVDSARRVSDVMDTRVRVIRPEDPVGAFDGLSLVADSPDSELLGVCDPLPAMGLEHAYPPAAAVMHDRYTLVSPDQDLVGAMRLLSAQGCEAMVVSRSVSDVVKVSEVCGSVGGSDIVRTASALATVL